jgi:hypothetical protein
VVGFDFVLVERAARFDGPEFTTTAPTSPCQDRAPASIGGVCGWGAGLVERQALDQATERDP